MEKNLKIGIVGAGIQGISNALFLQKKGFSVTQGPVATKGNCREFVSNVAVGKEFRKLRGTACRENKVWVLKNVY